MNKNHVITGVLVVAALFAGYFFAGVFGDKPLAGLVHSSQENFVEGIKAGKTDQLEITNSGGFTTSGAVSVTGATVVDDFTQGGTVRASSTDAGGAAETLTEAQMIANSIFEYSGTYGAALTITLPATSTMTTLLATAGDTRRWVFDNQFTAAATTTTIAAGTGIILMGVTANDDLIDGGEVSELVCWRKSDTDVGCIISELVDAD